VISYLLKSESLSSMDFTFLRDSCNINKSLQGFYFDKKDFILLVRTLTEQHSIVRVGLWS